MRQLQHCPPTTKNSVIAKKTGEIYGGLDADILAASGIEKERNRKDVWLRKTCGRRVQNQSGKRKRITNQIDSLTKEKARLEKAIADGATDAETAKALETRRKPI